MTNVITITYLSPQVHIHYLDHVSKYLNDACRQQMTDNFHFHGILEPYLSRIILMCRYTCYYHSIIVQYLVDMVNLSSHIKNWLGDDIIVIVRFKK